MRPAGLFWVFIQESLEHWRSVVYVVAGRRGGLSELTRFGSPSPDTPEVVFPAIWGTRSGRRGP